MAIEFWMELDCPVKQQLGLSTFKDMLRQRLIAQGLLERSISSGKTRLEALRESYQRVIMNPEGMHEVCDLNIGDTLEETKILDVLVDRCTDCPAAMGTGYGCYNVINYPISARSEAWLAAVAKTAGERRDTANIPVRVIFENRLSGRRFSSMRRETGARMFELAEPVEIRFRNGPFKRKRVNTDQVLDILFLNREMSGSFLENLSLFSGGLEVTDIEPREGTFQDASEAIGPKGTKIWFVFNLPEAEGDDLSIKQLKRFFRVVFRALELDKKVTVDA